LKEQLAMRGPDHDHDGHPDRVRTDGVHGGERVVHQPVADPALSKEIRRDAYERGRQDERSRHKSHPFLMLLLLIAALFGAAVLGLYAYKGGSFTRAGQTLDSVTARGAEEAREAGAEVADEAGEGLQDVGRRVEQEGEAASPPAPEPQPAQRR
jgi:hypothetical protein